MLTSCLAISSCNLMLSQSVCGRMAWLKLSCHVRTPSHYSAAVTVLLRQSLGPAAVTGSPCMAVTRHQLGRPVSAESGQLASTHLSAEHVEDGEHHNELPEVHHSVAIQI